MILYKFLRGFLGFFLFLFFRLSITGKTNEPKQGALLVCCNHISLLDPIIVARAVKRPVYFMAKRELFSKPVFKWLLPKVGAYPVSRGSNDIGAIKRTISLLKEDSCVGMFLQGTRQAGIDPRMTDVKDGVGMILAHTGADALPVSIYTKNNKATFGKRIHVAIGEPIKFAAGSERNRETYRKTADMIFERICALSEPESARGGDAARSDGARNKNKKDRA